jgi:hypothetical protein
MASLAEIRARLAAADGKKSEGAGTGFDNTTYPHWTMDDGKTSTLRFLPDGNSKNTFFWAERSMIRLPFEGIKGDSDSKPLTVRVPCAEMFGDTCPVLSEVRVWWKDASLEDMARKYWKKRDYFFQGFVRENPIQEENAPENPIRKFIIGPQLFTIIKAALMDPELEELPIDYLRGLDFRIVKTSKGKYADYNTSNWARRESALTASEQAAIEAYGLVDLSTYLPKRPDATELKVIQEMFEASVDGQPYDADKWAQYFKPAGNVLPSAYDAAPKAERDEKPAPAPAPKASKVDDEPAPWEDDVRAAEESFAPEPKTAPKQTGQKAEDILALIRSRQQPQ